MKQKIEGGEKLRLFRVKSGWRSSGWNESTSYDYKVVIAESKEEAIEICGLSNEDNVYVDEADIDKKIIFSCDLLFRDCAEGQHHTVNFYDDETIYFHEQHMAEATRTGNDHWLNNLKKQDPRESNFIIFKDYD